MTVWRVQWVSIRGAHATVLLTTWSRRIAGVEFGIQLGFYWFLWATGRLRDAPCAAADVDGGWTLWSLGGNSCNATCGTGYYRKLRTCSNPSPQGAGQKCLNSDGVTRALQEIATAECNTHPCASGEWRRAHPEQQSSKAECGAHP